MGQSSDGSWSNASRSILAACVKGECIDDTSVKSALDLIELTNDDNASRESAYLTLLAWYILEESFADNEDEWQLIIKNAKAFLERVGI